MIKCLAFHDHYQWKNHEICARERKNRSEKRKKNERVGMRGWDWGIRDLVGMRELEVEEIAIVNGNANAIGVFGVTKGL